MLAEKNKTKPKKDYVRSLHVLIIFVPVVEGVQFVENLHPRHGTELICDAELIGNHRINSHFTCGFVTLILPITSPRWMLFFR